MTQYGQDLLSNNPHVKFYNAQRGYVSNTLTAGSWIADFKVLPRVTVAGEQISTRASFAIEAGRPGVQSA
jgi:alkaline phosphatase D